MIEACSFSDLNLRAFVSPYQSLTARCPHEFSFEDMKFHFISSCRSGPRTTVVVLWLFSIVSAIWTLGIQKLGFGRRSERQQNSISCWWSCCIHWKLMKRSIPHDGQTLSMIVGSKQKTSNLNVPCPTENQYFHKFNKLQQANFSRENVFQETPMLQDSTTLLS